MTLNINDLDESAPSITSGATATAIDENTGTGQVIYTATSTDNGDVATGSTVYSLGGTDAGLLSINSSNGEVTLTGDPDFETKASYSFTVTATDAASNASTPQAVTLAINDVAEGRSTDTNIVVFDLVGGTSSDHSSRSFDANTAYTIYIRVDSDSTTLKTDANSGNGTWGMWSNANNLGADDRIIFAGDSGAFNIRNASESASYLYVSRNSSLILQNIGIVSNWNGITQTVDIWNGSVADMRLDSGAGADLYTDVVPAGILTSQGLA